LPRHPGTATHGTADHPTIDDRRGAGRSGGDQAGRAVLVTTGHTPSSTMFSALVNDVSTPVTCG